MLFNTLALFRARVFYFKVKSNNYILDYNSREAKNRIPATFKIFGLTIIIYEILRKVVAPTIISCLRFVLFERRITYVPDFLTNRMGIVNCANEQYGYVKNDPEINQHFSKDWKHSIYNVTQQVLKESDSSNKPTAEIALKIADELSIELHPIFGHRGKQIINSLVDNEWQE